MQGESLGTSTQIMMGQFCRQLSEGEGGLPTLARSAILAQDSLEASTVVTGKKGQGTGDELLATLAVH